ncbi:uncharacterized protein LOC122060176 [Macadamia integrifolia]|uniref:uncharacterized protein LOC122060176 n=1 Tax=Macadamia integrifolia TaxID=60698 RepID=UPI001C5306B4|nr:uncharacterized protein LOC122060176 [Macadamia integrifolia]XP_042479307.1 uncharacterized protein LOC122060176 [Macadamia integrifolia]
MGRGGCMNGELDTTLYSSPVPLIGLYIAAGTLVCFFCMTFDLVYAFIQKKPFVPCKLFPMNSFTLTVLAVATKIPLDLTTSMPRAEDQLSKLMGTALLCTALGFYIPSLGTMGTSERFGNMAALSVMVITMVANVCIQMGTRVIFAFTIEHIIIMVCLLVLLLFMWSSAIAFRGQTDDWGSYFRSEISKDIENAKKGPQGLRKLLVKLHVINYTGNPQTLLCETTHHHVFCLLCALSSAVVLQAMIRSFALKNMRLYCSASDYGWSIPIMIVAQLLTIVVGTFSIIYRWFSFFSHSNKSDLHAHKDFHFYQPERELEYLKLKTLPFRFFSSRKKLSNICLVAKKIIMNVLMRTQIVLYDCSGFFIGFPIYTVKTFLRFIIPFDRIFFHEHTEDKDIEIILEEISIFDMSELEDIALSSLCRYPFKEWIVKMGIKDMMRWRNTDNWDRPTHLIQLISKCPTSGSASKSERSLLLIKKLEAIGKEVLRRKEAIGYRFEYEYRVSCVSVLVLSGMLAELMPSSSRRESLLQSLSESFETIYYVDQRTTDTPSVDDKRRWTAAKDVWAQWGNPHHWFQTKIISSAFKKKFKEYSKLDQLHHAIGDAYDAIEKTISIASIQRGSSLAKKHMALIGTELQIICTFILQEQQQEQFESAEDVFDLLEKCFAEMLYFSLSGLPKAILKDIDEDDPTEIGEGRVKKAWKFLCKLELLGDTIEWSWPLRFEPESQANVVHSDSPPVVALDYGYSEVEANVSNVIDGEVCNSDVSLAATACAVEEEDDDDEIKEIGSDEIV